MQTQANNEYPVFSLDAKTPGATLPKKQVQLSAIYNKRYFRTSFGPAKIVPDMSERPFFNLGSILLTDFNLVIKFILSILLFKT